MSRLEQNGTKKPHSAEVCQPPVPIRLLPAPLPATLSNQDPQVCRIHPLSSQLTHSPGSQTRRSRCSGGIRMIVLSSEMEARGSSECLIDAWKGPQGELSTQSGQVRSLEDPGTRCPQVQAPGTVLAHSSSSLFEQAS
uniref:Uncharacterized protein n=1 Tax=Myotis myotis TaxID=51298 RepID=A0A7J7T5Z6_MYOMY|nr:hypothetical protein mMyoMyo1_009186 [Myotis myotis]